MMKKSVLILLSTCIYASDSNIYDSSSEEEKLEEVTSRKTVLPPPSKIIRSPTKKLPLNSRREDELYESQINDMMENVEKTKKDGKFHQFLTQIYPDAENLEEHIFTQNFRTLPLRDMSDPYKHLEKEIEKDIKLTHEGISTNALDIFSESINDFNDSIMQHMIQPLAYKVVVQYYIDNQIDYISFLCNKIPLEHQCWLEEQKKYIGLVSTFLFNLSLKINSRDIPITDISKNAREIFLRSRIEVILKPEANNGTKFDTWKTIHDLKITRFATFISMFQENDIYKKGAKKDRINIEKIVAPSIEKYLKYEADFLSQHYAKNRHTFNQMVSWTGIRIPVSKQHFIKLFDDAQKHFYIYCEGIDLSAIKDTHQKIFDGSDKITEQNVKNATKFVSYFNPMAYFGDT